MSDVLLLQLDGSFPNLALMRISAHHKQRGDRVRLKRVGSIDAVERATPGEYSKIYASLLFSRSRVLAENIKFLYPQAVIGGSGWDNIPHASDSLVSISSRLNASTVTRLEDHGITTAEKDYSLYPTFDPSIGFTQRGCRLGCGFCDVPIREGKIRHDQSIHEIWRGAPWPKKLILWDNDTFGNPVWRERFKEITDGGFKVSFNQGVNARLMNEENAEALAALPCYDDQFKVRCIYTAWDNRNDEAVLFRGLRRLVACGVRPDNIMVYMLIGYWSGETAADREYRRAKLRDFGARPYPMPYVRTHELIGFQRWVVKAYDKTVPWSYWTLANYEPRNLPLDGPWVRTRIETA